MSRTALITSADAVFTLTVKTLFNAPITLENWATDHGWSGSQKLKLATTSLSIDGRLNKGFVPSAYHMALHFSAGSRSLPVFDAIATASRQARTVYELNGELLLHGLGQRFTFTNGCLTDYDPVPAGNTTLGNRTVNITWENVLPAGL
ncbi:MULTISPECIES: phage tail fiber protein [Acetobacteraceae]|uniref:phage tail fiber protein n=1 Tax=Acetobacteraceae TaxID=433 RepID=UPI002011A4BA|nr:MULTISPECIES: hypothetical protein [Acetobacteraceae]MCL1562999.1 hypothetical protein [Parasaccharibacter sp. TMW 2.1886]MCL1514399.1 hypothetical protein [Parasaccharibacter sp. TMW2.1890]MCT6814017.1 hypothetical protein [Bombella apis]MCT6820361.1 hypothetical protein [Bombella apis]MCT6846073.1 hypothetical protein [Bombella apis]